MAANGITARIKAFTDDEGTVLAQNIALPGVPKDADGNYFMELWEGEEYKLSAEVFPEEAVQKVQWESSDDTVASVQSDGTLLAAGVGQTLVRAATADGSGVFVECLVNVRERENMTFYEQGGTGSREKKRESGWKRQRGTVEQKQETAEAIAAVGNVDTSDGVVAEILFLGLLAAVCLCGIVKGVRN